MCLGADIVALQQRVPGLSPSQSKQRLAVSQHGMEVPLNL